MLIALILAVVVAVLALMVAAAALVRATKAPPLAGKTMVVHTRKPDDRTLRGVLHGEYADRWVLRDASVILPGGHEQALGGIEHVPTANISFAQEVEVPAAPTNGDQP